MFLNMLKKNKKATADQVDASQKIVRSKLSEGGFEEALSRLTGEYVWVWCVNYVYAGQIVDVSATDVLLHDATIVLESGDFKDKHFKEFENIPVPVHVRTSSIESFSQCWKRPK
jgi:hypothetical protein